MKYVSSVEHILYFEKSRSNKQQMFCYCFFHAFAPTFTSNSAFFCWWGAKMFLPTGAGYPNYATELYCLKA